MLRLLCALVVGAPPSSLSARIGCTPPARLPAPLTLTSFLAAQKSALSFRSDLTALISAASIAASLLLTWSRMVNTPARHGSGSGDAVTELVKRLVLESVGLVFVVFDPHSKSLFGGPGWPRIGECILSGLKGPDLRPQPTNQLPRSHARLTTRIAHRPRPRTQARPTP